jgi:DNA gyrase inhibitor GyrI
MPLLFVRVRGPYPEAAAAAWARLLAWADERGIRADVARAFGLNRDHARSADAECRYDACIEAPVGVIEDPSAGVGMQMLPGGAYGRHRHSQGREEIGAAFIRLEREWAPSRGMTLDTSRPLIEAYLSSDPLAVSVRMDLCLPVQAASNRRTAA